MRKVVITGATGMIGISLIKYLLSQNIEILAIIRKNSKRKSELPNDKKLKVIEYNLNELKYLDINENDYDVFYHFGWDGTFGDERNDKEKQLLNIEYTKDAVYLAKRLGCKTFIGAGSQAEFGRVEGVINKKTHPKPENEYGKAKFQACLESRKIANNLKIKHIWSRIFSIYGPYDGENTMVMSSIREMLQGNSPEYTEGNQDWDYLYIEDAVRALFLIAENGKNNKVYFIAYGKTRKLYEYIEIIKNNINPNIILKLGAKPYAENQVMNLNVDISELEKECGFKPQYTFEEGILKTIKWYKNHFIDGEKI